jgi:hypothetical protein
MQEDYLQTGKGSRKILQVHMIDENLGVNTTAKVARLFV